MLIWENIKLALAGILGNKMRSVLTMLGIIIGIGSVIAILTVSASLTSSITSTFAELGANNITVGLKRQSEQQETRSNGMKFGLSGRESSLDEEDRITDEMINRDEWEGVLVPAGVYEIGVDIPEGKWTISAEPTSNVIVKLGSGIDETYTDFPDGGYITYEHLIGEQHRRYDISDTVSVTWNLSKGHYIISNGPTIWTHAIRPSLGFN